MSKKQVCPTCNGEGWVVKKHVFQYNDSYDEPVYNDVQDTCPTCVVLKPAEWVPNPKYLQSNFFKHLNFALKRFNLKKKKKNA